MALEKAILRVPRSRKSSHSIGQSLPKRHVSNTSALDALSRDNADSRAHIALSQRRLVGRGLSVFLWRAARAG